MYLDFCWWYSCSTEQGLYAGNYPCASHARDSPPPFVADNYYCETAALNSHNFGKFILMMLCGTEQGV